MSLIPDDKLASRPVLIERIYALANTHDALEYACELSRTPDGKAVVPKQIYPRMGVDKSTWSRICSGEWDLDGRDILQFCRTIGNDAYFFYIAHSLGYDLNSLRKAQDDKDKEIEQLRQQLADQDRAIQLMVGYQRSRSA